MGKARAIVLGLAVAISLLAAVELSLRLVGFTREVAPIALRFGYPNLREIVDLFRPDPRLFWRLVPGSVFDAEAQVPINRLGYRGPLPRTPRPEGLLRVAVMGDSVAFGSATAWPELLAGSLEERIAPRPVEVLNFGVPGYSVVQGLRQFEAEVAPLRPGVVLIAYGWNDHWLARAGVPDTELAPPSRGRAAVALFLARLRIAQAIRALIVPGTAPAGASRGAGTHRVPLDSYRSELGRFVTAVREAGANPIVVGLPSALTEADLPAYLVDGGFTASPADAVADHARYLEAAREAASSLGAVFVDAGAALGGESRLFTRDRIHLSAEGHAALAAAALEPVLTAGVSGNPR